MQRVLEALTLAGGKPTASAHAGKLAVITHPNGTKQVTANGKPLYTFAEDSPGRATANGFTDDFGGHHFTWNVVHAGGKTNTAGGTSTAPSSTNHGD
jgi:hypothetical protein